jgi:hypothetical protein
MKVAAVTKSGASDMAERSSARRSPLSCGLEATAALSRFESLKSPLQICIFGPHTLELLRSAGGELSRAGSGHGEPYCFRILEIGLDGRNDDSRFYSRELDTDEGDANPGVDDNTLVENAIENID